MALLAIGLGTVESHWYDFLFDKDPAPVNLEVLGTAKPVNLEVFDKPVYPSQNPADYTGWVPYADSGITASQSAAALSYLATTYPDLSQVPEGYELVSSEPAGVSPEGRPIYKVVVVPKGGADDTAKKPTDCPKGTMLPCVPDWMLWGGIAMFAFMRSR
jgi:hypothetical protein